MRTVLSATLLVAGHRAFAVHACFGADDAADPPAGTKPKPVDDHPDPPAADCKSAADTAGAMAQAERLALQSDLAWVGEYNGAITGEVSERMVNAIKEFQKSRGAKQTGVLNPQERGALADTARRRQDRCRLENHHRCRHRRAARHSHKTRAAADQRCQRRQMDLADRHRPDRIDAAQGSEPDHGEARRAGEEGERPRRRLQRREAGLLRPFGGCRA